MLALPLLVLPLQNLGDTYHYGGDYGAPNDYRLVKTNAECASGDLKLGEFATVAECAAACRQSACRFFIYGHDYAPTKRGHCWHEFAYDASCPEGWEEDEYDFYELVWTPPAPPPAAPPGLPWAHGFAPVRDAAQRPRPVPRGGVVGDGGQRRRRHRRRGARRLRRALRRERRGGRRARGGVVRVVRRDVARAGDLGDLVDWRLLLRALRHAAQ